MAYIEMRHLQKIYRQGAGRVTALREVNLQVETGELAAIVGRSGSGKSTLMNVLGCLDTPDGGEYRLNGQDMRACSPRELAKVRNREIGFVFQQFHLLNRLTALENVELPLIYRGLSRAQCRERATACLTQLGLRDRMNHRPSALSGGQQQRVAIARAMAGEPPLLLADEPTGNLDKEAGALVMEALYRLHRQGHTVILITHDPALAAAAPRRLQMESGVLREMK